MDLWIPGRPVAAERPRLGRRRRASTPQKTIDAELAIAAKVMSWGGCSPDHPFHEATEALELVVDYSNDGQRIRLQSLGERDKAMRGDIDNYLKTTMDGLQKGGAFANDSQVVRVFADKWPAWADLEGM